MVYRLISFIGLLFITLNSNAENIIKFSPKEGDRTLEVRKALEKASKNNLTVVFEKGEYLFLPDLAYEQECFVTNHENGVKRIAFNFDGFKNLTIKGNGSDFIFHGQMMPFRFEDCENVKVEGIQVDWDIPFSFQAEVIEVNEKEGWRIVKPYSEGFSWKLKNQRIVFPDVDEFSFSCLGSSLPFDPKTKNISHAAMDQTSMPTKVIKLENGNLKIFEKQKYYAPVGSILHSKGKKGENRYAPAFHMINSKELHFNKTVVHHAIGMGYLAEKCENVTIVNSGVFLKKGTNRVVSSLADATHFCNVKGKILIENCRFENMLDDGTNVHGTYVVVDKVLDDHTVRVKLAHFQQSGFQFTEKGDEIWFIHSPSPARKAPNTVSKVESINSIFSNITFDKKLPKELKQGDLLENKTYNPEFTMRGCEIKNHRARNIVLKSPLKTVIENNKLSSMMSSILFRGESYYWYESGGVKDVIIRNNEFTNCAISGKEHAVMWITPRLNAQYSKTETYDSGIKFINNTIRTFDARIVRADRASDLLIEGNKIYQTKDLPPIFPDRAMFEFENCKTVKVSNNSYEGDERLGFKVDKATRKSIMIKNNKGIQKIN